MDRNSKNLKSLVLGLPGKDTKKFFDHLQDAGVKDVKLIDCTELMQFEPNAVYNDTHLSKFLKGKPRAEAIYCPIVDNGYRQIFLAWARELGYATPNFVHRTAEVDPTVKLEPNAGIYVFEGTKIGPNVKIGGASIIMWNVCIEEDAKLGKEVLIYDEVSLGKGCTICDGAYIDFSVSPGEKVYGDSPDSSQ